MSLGERVACTIVALMLLLIAAVMVASWRAGRVPRRPKGVAANAVFLWAPHVGFPSPRRGWWLSCWENARHNRCQLSDIAGGVEYEGDFVPYGKRGFVPGEQLKIASEKTRDNKVWIGKALVPLVYLQNGEILVPVDNYDDSARLIEKSGHNGNR